MTNAGVHITWRGQTGSGEAEFAFVLAGAGRAPNLDGLGLEHARLELDENGMLVFDRATMQCGDASVFIAGDADHDRPVLHEANDEGAIAGSNAASWPKTFRGTSTQPPSPLFSPIRTWQRSALRFPPSTMRSSAAAILRRAGR